MYRKIKLNKCRARAWRTKCCRLHVSIAFDVRGALSSITSVQTKNTRFPLTYRLHVVHTIIPVSLRVEYVLSIRNHVLNNVSIIMVPLVRVRLCTELRWEIHYDTGRTDVKPSMDANAWTMNMMYVCRRNCSICLQLRWLMSLYVKIVVFVGRFIWNIRHVVTYSTTFSYLLQHRPSVKTTVLNYKQFIIQFVWFV